MVGRQVNTVSLIHQLFVQESCTFVVFHFANSHWRMSCTHRRVKAAYFVVRTERVAHVINACVGSRLDGQGHVDCLSPRAHQKSLTRFMCRGTLLESQFSSPSPFSPFCKNHAGKALSQHVAERIEELRQFMTRRRRCIFKKHFYKTVFGVIKSDKMVQFWSSHGTHHRCLGNPCHVVGRKRNGHDCVFPSFLCTQCMSGSKTILLHKG